MAKNTVRYSFEITKELKKKLDNLKRHENNSEFIREAIEKRLECEPFVAPPITIPVSETEALTILSPQYTISYPSLDTRVDSLIPEITITARPTDGGECYETHP